MDEKQLLLIGKQLIDLVKDIFPSHAEFNNRCEDNSFISIIHWKLNNDQNRPNKRSRIIKIKISQESIEDGYYTPQQPYKFQSLIKERYARFVPEHDASRDESPPMEEWLINSRS